MLAFSARVALGVVLMSRAQCVFVSGEEHVLVSRTEGGKTCVERARVARGTCARVANETWKHALGVCD